MLPPPSSSTSIAPLVCSRINCHAKRMQFLQQNSSHNVNICQAIYLGFSVSYTNRYTSMHLLFKLQRFDLSGYVPKGQVFNCIAAFAPIASTNVQSLQATCEVQGKTVCKLLFTGSCTTPKVSFSFTTHDFGALFVPHASDMPFDDLSVKPRTSSQAMLKITNSDAQHQCSISSPYSPTEGFDFQPLQVNLSPEEVLEIPVTFSPRETKLYRAKIPFFVNDQLAATIQLSGKGIPVR